MRMMTKARLRRSFMQTRKPKADRGERENQAEQANPQEQVNPEEQANPQTQSNPGNQSGPEVSDRGNEPEKKTEDTVWSHPGNDRNL